MDENRITVAQTALLTLLLLMIMFTAVGCTGSTGGLLIEVEPRGASVSYRGELLGQAPLHIPKFVTGSHTLKVSTDGYFEENIKVRISANQNHRVFVELTPTLELWKTQALKMNKPHHVAQLMLLYGLGMAEQIEFGVLWTPSVSDNEYLKFVLDMYGESLKEEVLPTANFVRAQGIDDKGFNGIGKSSSWETRFLDESIALVRGTVDEFPAFVVEKHTGKWYVARFLNENERGCFDSIPKSQVIAGNREAEEAFLELEALFETD